MTKWRSFIDPSVGDGQDTINGIIANGPTYGIGISDDLSVTGLSTFADDVNVNSDIYVQGDLRLGGKLKDGDNAFGSSGQVLSSDGSDTRWVNAGSLSAGAASQVAINDDSDTNADRFITFVDSSSGNNSVKTDGQLKFNPNTNDLTTTGDIVSGKGSGGVALTINDSQGNANVTFNHQNGVPEQNGNAARIEVNTDANSNATMFFELKSNVTGGSTVSLTSVLDLLETEIRPHRDIIPVSDSTKNIGSNGVRFANGYFDTVTSNLTGNVTGNVTGNLTGNADTATILANTRTIGGVSFNGSANINLPGVNQAGNQNTSGNAATATTLATSRNFSISGEITANTQSFNGSGNVTLNATVDNNVIDEANLKISNSPVNGRFLQCNTGVSGGLTWAEVTVPAANTLTGTTLASGITASSITSLGTLTGLTVSGNASISGQSTLTNKVIIDHNSGNMLELKPTNGNPWVISINRDDLTQSRVFTINPSNQGVGWAFEHCPYFYNGGSYNKFLTTADEGSGNGIDADTVDGQHGSYYRNAGNLNAGTIPDARLDDSSLFVTGMILMYTGSTAPSGWAICNGQNGTPDLRDRFIVGAGSAYSVNNTGGSNSVTLTVSQIPSHNHDKGTLSTNNDTHNHGVNDPGHTHTMNFNQGNIISSGGAFGLKDSGTANRINSNNTGISINNDAHNHSITGNTGSKGGSNSHENRPPYYALMFIMKL